MDLEHDDKCKLKDVIIENESIFKRGLGLDEYMANIEDQNGLKMDRICNPS